MKKIYCDLCGREIEQEIGFTKYPMIEMQYTIYSDFMKKYIYESIDLFILSILS